MIYIKHVREILDETRRDVDALNVRQSKAEHEISDNRHALRNHLDHHVWAAKTPAVRTSTLPDKPLLTAKQRQLVVTAVVGLIAALTVAMQDCGKTVEVLRRIGQ